MSQYKSIAVLDVTKEEKRGRQMPIFGTMPIWRWLWCQLQRISVMVDFIELDFNVDGHALIPAKSYDVVLVYIEHYIPEWLAAFFTEMQLSERKSLIVLCGFLPTVIPEKLQERYPEVEMVLSGPLEISLAQFCKMMYSEKDTNLLCDTNYCSYPKEGIISKVLESEYQENFLSSPVGIVQSSSGCPRRCSFCRYSEFYHEYYPYIYKQYSMQEIIVEIMNLIENYNIRYIRFLDSNFLGSGKLVYQRACEFADTLKENNIQITFAIHCRSDSITEDVIEILSAVGLKYVSVGIESMSKEQLERFGKQETTNAHWNAVNILKNKKIFIQGYAILADPLMTRNELLNNLKGLCELSKVIQIVINERMILYTTTNYYRKYKNEILNLQPVESSLGIVVEYDFCDEWCNKYFKYVEQTSIWLQQMIIKKYHDIKQKHRFGSDGNDIQKMTTYRLEALIEIVSIDTPDDELIDKLKKHIMEKIDDMRGD